MPHDQAIRYLGVHCRFDGSWQTQHSKSLSMVQKFTSVVSKFDVSLSQARYMFNVFLMPKLELALHYVHGPGTRKFIQNCDRTLVGCIKHAVSSPLQLSHRAVAHSLGIILPSRLEAAVSRTLRPAPSSFISPVSPHSSRHFHACCIFASRRFLRLLSAPSFPQLPASEAGRTFLTAFLTCLHCTSAMQQDELCVLLWLLALARHFALWMI